MDYDYYTLVKNFCNESRLENFSLNLIFGLFL